MRKMKKHAGNVVTSGLLISVFALMLFGMMALVTGMVIDIDDAPLIVSNAVEMTGGLAWALIIIGGALLLLGLFLHTRMD